MRDSCDDQLAEISVSSLRDQLLKKKVIATYHLAIALYHLSQSGVRSMRDSSAHHLSAFRDGGETSYQR